MKFREVEDIRKVNTWYVIRGNEHLRMGSWEDALEIVKTSQISTSLMSEEFYNQHYKKIN